MIADSGREYVTAHRVVYMYEYARVACICMHINKRFAIWEIPDKKRKKITVRIVYLQVRVWLYIYNIYMTAEVGSFLINVYMLSLFKVYHTASDIASKMDIWSTVYRKYVIHRCLKYS